MRMPWGKHRDKDLSEVPLGYLAWALEEADSLDWRLRDELVSEVGRRLGLVRPGHPVGAPPRQSRSESELAAAFDRWFRAAVLRVHPDRGGDAAMMAMLNNLRDEFRAVVRGGGGER